MGPGVNGRTRVRVFITAAESESHIEPRIGQPAVRFTNLFNKSRA